MTIIDTIQNLEKTNNNNKLESAKLQERAKGLKEEKDKLLVSLKELGLKEEELVAKINDLETELNNRVAEIEKEIK
ncbi:MAG: hypothetical protein WC516_05970 [Patescibacteria group bacterium]|jgi:chromosome segregation ATPase